MDNIYYILAGLAVVYILFAINNKRVSSKRKSRKFMDGYQRRKDAQSKSENAGDNPK